MLNSREDHGKKQTGEDRTAVQQRGFPRFKSKVERIPEGTV